jgi:hypothetical protein
MGDAAGTEHLEGVDNYRLAAQPGQGYRHVGIEPSFHKQFGGDVANAVPRRVRSVPDFAAGTLVQKSPSLT